MPQPRSSSGRDVPGIEPKLTLRLPHLRLNWSVLYQC
jgi:hypothetical protein